MLVLEKWIGLVFPSDKPCDGIKKKVDICCDFEASTLNFDMEDHLQNQDQLSQMLIFLSF